jgi:NhaP-type Na+/H+ or K+/H+ antiporter
MPQETSSHHCTASCVEGNNLGDEETTDTMKQPLLSERDSGTRKSDFTSCNNLERRPRTIMMIVKILLTGIAAGLVLQATTISAYVIILKVWGREPHPQDLSNCVMYYIFFLLSQAVPALYYLVAVTVTVFVLKAGSAPMASRKKFDREDGTSTKEGGSIWSSLQLIFLAGHTFLFGMMFGSFTAWAAVDYKVGMPLRLGPLIAPLLVYLFVLLVVFICFDWAQEGNDETSTDEEQEEGDATILV